MRYKTNIRLVDTHTKGNGGNDDNLFFPQKTLLMLLPYTIAQTRMVWQRRTPLGYQPFRRLFYLFPRQTINDTRIVGMFLFNELQ